MPLFWWTFFVVGLAVFEQGKCENTAYPVIPKHLLECYIDDGIYHRANRMPSTFESFLDLLRKVEDSPTARNMNARELSLALLHFLKLDGIQSIRSHTKYFPSNVLPFAPAGPEYFKHRLMLVGLIPRIDHSFLTAFNESLTKKEMCNLHFMLSYSIDPYKREGERCSPLFEEFRRGFQREPKSDWNSYQSNRDYHIRSRRYVANRQDLNRPNSPNKKKDKEHFEKGLIKQEKKSLREPQEKNRSERLLSRKTRSEPDKKSQVEKILVHDHPYRNEMTSPEEKDKFTIGNQELLSAGERRPFSGLQSVVHAEGFGNRGGRPYVRPAYTADEGFYSGILPDIPLSDCPVVNGVIGTPFGSLTIGTVIAGVAAGLNPEEIPPTKLSVDPLELGSPSDKVKNIWASTLAGTVADVISSSALLDQNNWQVLKGGWNESYDFKWYLLTSNQFKHLTEVALRGGLDGLYLGINAKEWTGRYSGFKLSQMLQTYYDCLWGTVGAKHRVDFRPKYAPDEIFKKQVHLMSLVLKNQKTNVFTLLEHKQIATEIVNKVTQHIQMIDKEKSHLGSFLTTKIENSINTIAVIDSSWGQEYLYEIFHTFREARVAGTLGNNLTIVCGKDGRVLLSSKNGADIHKIFTKDMLFENCTRGMDLSLIFDKLDTMYRKIFYDEKISRKMNIEAQVVLLFPFEPLFQENSYVIEKCKNFRGNFPGVRLMIASNGKSESFLPLVESPKDLFSLSPYSSDFDVNSIRDLTDGMKQRPAEGLINVVGFRVRKNASSPWEYQLHIKCYQRISRPSCGSYFDDESQMTEARVTSDFSPGNTVYYRLLPHYFYTQHGQATVTVRSKQRTPLTVCHSREMERPAGPTPRGGSGSDYNRDQSPDYIPDFPPEFSLYGRQTNGEPEGPVHCKTITSDPYRIELNNPCEGASSLRECPPLYISLTSPLPETVSIICLMCKLPTNVEYEIIATGLTCYNSAMTMLVSPILFFFIFINYLLNH